MIEISDYIEKNRFVKYLVNGFFYLVFFLVRHIRKKDYISGNIVIVSIMKLGDTVFTIPSVKEIQRYYKSNITIVCFPESVPIYQEVFTSIKYLELSHSHFYFNGRIAKSIARKQITSLKPEIIFDLNGRMTSVSLIIFCRSKINIGMAYRIFKAFYDYYLEMERFPHLIDRYHKIISQIVPTDKQKFEREFPISEFQGKGILIQPFAGWKAKEWNLRKFIELATRLANYYEVSLIIPDKSINIDIITEIEKRGIKLLITKSIDDLIQNIKECAVLIGNDSGPIHIASLLGKPTFSIYGPTNPIYSAPIGNHHINIKSEIKCAPKGVEELCFTYGGRKGCPSFECMNLISVDMVFEKVLVFLKNNI